MIFGGRLRRFVLAVEVSVLAGITIWQAIVAIAAIGAYFRW